MSLFQQLVVKLGALFSFCGGPLLVCDVLKPRLGNFPAFIVPFVPIVLMIFGADSLFDTIRRPQRDPTRPLSPVEEELESAFRWADLCVRLGLVGAVLTLIMHGYGISILATMPARPDRVLYIFGIVVGVPLAAIYLYAARRWLNSAGPRHPFSPLEPS